MAASKCAATGANQPRGSSNTSPQWHQPVAGVRQPPSVQTAYQAGRRPSQALQRRRQQRPRAGARGLAPPSAASARLRCRRWRASGHLPALAHCSTAAGWKQCSAAERLRGMPTPCAKRVEGPGAAWCPHRAVLALHHIAHAYMPPHPTDARAIPANDISMVGNARVHGSPVNHPLALDRQAGGPHQLLLHIAHGRLGGASGYEVDK